MINLYISKQQGVLAISRGFYFHEILHVRSFAKIKPSRKLPNLQLAVIMPSVPFGPSDQSLNLKNMVYHVVAFFVLIAMFGLRIKTLRLCNVDIYMSRQNQIEV